MTRIAHDQFAKGYLSSLFAQVGTVTASYTLSSEIKEIDILFQPRPNAVGSLESLGLLGRMAIHFCLLEPYRNPVQAADLEACLSKGLEVRLQQRRHTKRQKTPAKQLISPRLWILSPTASQPLIQSWGASQNEAWGAGVFFLADALQTAIVVLHQLPPTLDTLWLRLLGRGSVQTQAVAELLALSSTHAFRKVTLEHLAKLQLLMKTRQKKRSKDEQELVDNLNPVYEAWEHETIERGRQEGIERGRQEGIERGRQEERRLMLARTVALLLQAGMSIEAIAQHLQVEAEAVRQAVSSQQN
jgi:hypothetical protein